MTRHAAAYIRRSSVSVESPGDASRDAQLAAVRSMCGDEVEVYTDWGISGQKADRPDYVRLKEDVAAGKVASVCAYSLSRLGRSSRELLTFVDLCRSHGVTIRTSVENLDTSTAMGVAMLTVMAAFAQLEADSARERQASARKARVDRGDDMSAPYGYRLEEKNGRKVRTKDQRGYRYDTQPNGKVKRVRDDGVAWTPVDTVLAAYRDAGTVLGACRLLESRGIPAPRGGKRWATSALTRILEREDPGLLPRRAASGLRSPGRAALAQLLRCPFCTDDEGNPVVHMLTPNRTRGQLYCSNGPRKRATHPRYTVREVDVLPWVQAEAERFDPPGDELAIEGIQGKRDAAEARLERAQELYIAGEIKRERFDAQKTQVQREIDALTAESSAAGLSGRTIAWDGDEAKLNDFLRSIFVGVDLDENLRPVRVERRIEDPAWWRAE